PTTVKIPDPMTAPIPNAVQERGPRVFLRRRSGSSGSAIRLSMDLQQKSWLPFFWVSGCSVWLVVVGGCAKGPLVCVGPVSDPGRRVQDPPPHGQLCAFRLA